MRCLFVMDPAETMLPDKDTSFAFMRGATARGHECWHCLPGDVAYAEGIIHARATRIEVADRVPHVTLRDRRRLVAHDVDVVFVRKDPPFDTEYLHLTQLLSLLPERPLVVNSPRGLQAANEKLFTLNFAPFIPRTLVSANRSELLDFLKSLGGPGVLKPLDGAGGFGVVQVSLGDKNAKALIDLLTHEGKQAALLQEFLPAVSGGDKRVLLLDGKLLGAIRRIPQPDDIRANIHVGGRVEPTDLTASELAVVDAVGPRLVEQGLYFVGLDMIDGRLIEVNVTSPTGIQQLSRHVGRPLELDVIAWAEARVLAPQRTPA